MSREGLVPLSLFPLSPLINIFDINDYRPSEYYQRVSVSLTRRSLMAGYKTLTASRIRLRIITKNLKINEPKKQQFTENT